MTFREIHTNYSERLKSIYSKGEAAAITDIIFRFFAGLSGSELIVKGHIIPDNNTLSGLENSLAKLLQYIPVQYVTGEAWFCGLQFRVNKNVLIPRPETEELVQEAIHFLKGSTGKNVLEIGSGSGCIPITIKKFVPVAQVVSVELSRAALDVAEENAAANKADVDFREMDFLKEKHRQDLPVFDVIISNPPYIPEEEKNLLDKNVSLHEPGMALFVPQNDPLVFYREIYAFAKTHLKKNGIIFLEADANRAKQTAAIFSGKNISTEIKKDMSGNERFIIARYSSEI